MRQYALVAGLGLLLTLGACAAQKSTRDGMAPSRAASSAKPLDDNQYYAPSEPGESKQPAEQKAKAPESDVMQAAYTRPDTDKPAVEHVPVEQGAAGNTAKPLVPAFPAKMEQDKLRDMKTVFFLFDKAELTPDAKQLLATNATWLKAHPNVRVRVEGHCDERGTSEYNLALGSRRSNQVRDYLVS
ncbi:MAG TPA: OmpA family protein, partial [bacterium]